MSTFDKVKEVVIDKLGVEDDKVVSTASFVDDLGADSLDTVELIMQLEEEFGIEIPDEEAETITTVQAAVDYMRSEFNKIDMDGKIVIGEGEMDEAPMLFIGERVGTKKGQKLDLAVDPLECTNFVAKNLPNSFSVLTVTEKDNLFFAPDTYMEKIAIGTNLPKDLIDLDYSVEKNIKRLADAKNVNPENLTVCILDRPRHKEIISSLKSLKVSAESGKVNTADVTLSINNIEQSASAKTSGAVDATFNAILSLVDIEPKLQLYSVTNVTQGTDSLGEVNVRLEHEGKVFNGQGVDTDIITSSAKAYVNALNKVMANEERAHPQI